MSKRDWSHAETDFFVSLYRNHECLWKDSYSPAHTIQKQKQDAYASIIQKMFEATNIKLDNEQIQEKIANLQAMYIYITKEHRHNTECKKQWYKEMEYVMLNSGYKPNNITSEYPLTRPGPIVEDTSEEMLNLDGEEELKPAVSKDSLMMGFIKSNRITVLNILKKLYIDNVSHNLLHMLDILTETTKADNQPVKFDFKMFENMMNLLGFKHKETITGKKMLVEKAEQRFERYVYFTKIRRARALENREIVYIDERIINPKLSFDKIYSLENGIPNESLIYFHAFTRDGLLNGLFCNQVKEEDFAKWVSSILLNYLKSPSLVIMDNGPLHGVLEDTCPITRYSTKSEMIKWLNDNNIPCSMYMPRPLLFELIKANRRDSNEYRIDKILTCHGHEVLRLPTTFPDLNMTCIFWDAVVQDYCYQALLKAGHRINQKNLPNKIRDLISSMTKKKWREMEKRLILKETEIFQIDTVIENVLATCVFKNN